MASSRRPAPGTLARSGILDAEGLDVVERGYLLIPEALLALENGDAATALGCSSGWPSWPGASAT